MRRRDSSAQVIEIFLVGREIRGSTIFAHKLPRDLQSRPLPSRLDLASVDELQTFLYKGSYLALYGSKGDICKAGKLAQIEGFADVAV